MKLCKDCKHAHMPHPSQQLSSNYYGVAMCAHPSAPRDCVEGRLEASCAGARGIALMLRINPFCGEDAKLFEERPAPKPDAGSVIYLDWADRTYKRSWLARLFGW